MSDAAIKAALDAAARMICGGGMPNGCPSCSPEQPCGDHWRNFTPETAAAIAAFLREMAKEPVSLTFNHEWHDLAARVQEAARDDR